AHWRFSLEPRTGASVSNRALALQSRTAHWRFSQSFAFNDPRTTYSPADSRITPSLLLRDAFLQDLHQIAHVSGSLFLLLYFNYVFAAGLLLLGKLLNAFRLNVGELFCRGPR